MRNVGSADRSARVVIGAVLVVWAAAGGPVWAWIGAVPLVTGLMGICPAYSLIGISTCRRKA